MKKILVWIFLATALTPSAFAMDHRSQFGVGGALGATFPAPWASETFRNQIDPALPVAGIWGRYIPGTPEVGTELSYHYLWVGKQKIHTHALIFSFISRQNPWGNFHPFYSFGVGYSKSDNWFTTGDWEAPIFKLTAGIEFELNDKTDVGFHLNHFSIFKNQPTEQNYHVLSPVITLNYYFGSPAPMPSAPVPTPAPAPAAAPAPAPAPAVSQPAQAPAKATPKKAKKKKAEKTKVKSPNSDKSQ